jgi:precorrin-3B synthase
MNRIATPPAVKGWCPGALRPMASGDGLIVRLKIPLGIMPTALAVRIAEWSRRWGSGVIELSARGNLQLRGITVSGLPALQVALSAAGLLDGSASAEAVRNISLSPLSDLDPDAVLNIHAPAHDLDGTLLRDRRLHRLPGKFGFAIDAGGQFGPAGADITFVACRTKAGPAFMVRLAGDAAASFGPCRPERLAEVAVSLAVAFLDAAGRQGGQARRMRDVVARCGATAIAAAAGLSVFAPAGVVTPRSEASDLLGCHAIGAAAFAGLGLLFGQIDAAELAELAKSAEACGAATLRLTPWRAILAPLPSLDAAERLIGRCANGKFIVDPTDPRRRIAACTGAPRCHHGEVPAREAALFLAKWVSGIPGTGILLHVSGCEKGCAHPAAAPITLTGRDGCYDLVLNGPASGAPVRRNLTLDQAADAAAAEMKVAAP